MRIGLHNRTGARREHDLHMAEGDGYLFRVEEFLIKYVVEVSRNKNFRAVGTSLQEMLQNTTEETCTVCIK